MNTIDNALIWILAITGFLLLFLGCDPNGPTVKLYVSEPDQGGIIRKQENELLLYPQTKGFICTSSSDFEAIMNWCSNKNIK